MVHISMLAILFGERVARATGAAEVDGRKTTLFSGCNAEENWIAESVASINSTAAFLNLRFGEAALSLWLVVFVVPDLFELSPTLDTYSAPGED